MSPRAILVGLAITLAPVLSGSDAEAECAWVLWSDELMLAHDVQKTWLPQGAWSDETMCQRAKENSIRRMARHPVISGGKVERRADGVLIVLPDGARQSVTYRCLPDTIDPRGPKGR
jgi:hypothetical protein